MTSSKINIKQVSKLANLPLSNQEESIYEEQLAAILKYIELIETVNTKETEPTFNVTTNKNITRKDVASKSLTQDQTLSNSSRKKDGFIVTRGVFVNE